MNKFVTVFAAAAALVSVSAFADFTVTNNSSLDSTMKINNVCTATVLGDAGVTHPNQSNSYGPAKIGLACGFGVSSCSAIIYADDHCGVQAGTGTLDIPSDILHITSSDPQGSKVTLNGDGTDTITIVDTPATK